MLKLIVTGIIVYFLYRVFFERPGIGGPKEKKQNIEHPQEEDEGEFIDYEEVD